MKAYLQSLAGTESSFSSTTLLGIMDSFQATLWAHLASEPPKIASLGQYSTAENPIDIVAISLKSGKKMLSLDYALNCLPMFLLNMEVVEFEDGAWSVFPPVPALVLFVMTKVIPLWRRSWWRFAACDGDRRRKRLEV